MPPLSKSGPYSGLPATYRRQGRGGHCFAGSGFPTGISPGDFLGHVVAVEWDVEAEQVDVLIPGGWRNEPIPGSETRRGTVRYQDVDDLFRMAVWRFFEARRQGDFSAVPPIFDLTTVLVGGPKNTKWDILGCQFFNYSGGYSNEDDVLVRDLPFTFRSDRPQTAFHFGPSGVVMDVGG